MARRVIGGVRLNGEWFCSERCLEPAVRQELALETSDMPRESAGSRPTLRLGAILRHQRDLTAAQLAEAVAAQQRSGLRLGAQVQQLGFATRDAVVRALAVQADMSYLLAIDLASVRRAPGGLPGHTVRALGLVPFDADAGRRRLRVLCTAPPPRAAFRALTALAGWETEPYLVDDALWVDAAAAYGADVQAPAGLVGDLGAAVARVTRAAGAAGSLTMRRAECPGGLWVRLEDEAHVEDVVVRTKEAPCLVASTLH